MTRIVVLPERLQELGRQWQHAANELIGLEATVRQAGAALDWEIRSMTTADESIGVARTSAATLSSHAQQIGRFLQIKAEVFEQADRGGVKLLDTSQWRDAVQHIIQRTLEDRKRFSDLMSRILPILGFGAIIGSGATRSVTDIAGIVRDRDKLLHDLLIAAKHEWWEAYMRKDEAAMDAAHSRAERLRQLGATVSDEEDRQINDGYKSQIASQTPPAAPPSAQPTKRPYDSVDSVPIGKGVPLNSLEQWKPVDAPTRSTVAERNSMSSAGRVDRYNQVLNQFDVSRNPRYAQDENTYCNIFTWDASRAMGAEVPHWVMPDGTPVAPGTRGSRELDANNTVLWLQQHGAKYGWRTVTPEEAQVNANDGRPSMAVWPNPGGIGHVAMVRPGEYEAATGPWIANVGARNFEKGTTQQGFGKTNGVLYFVHE